MKNKILDVARSLFNEKGYHNTSMRDISGTLHISVGNLTYHYKKKEDILYELCALDFYGERSRYNSSITLEQLNEFLYGMMKVVIDYKYFFCDPQIVEILPKELVEQTDSRISDVMDEFREYLSYLNDRKIINIPKEMYAVMSEILMFSHIGWIQSRTDVSIEKMMYMQWMLMKQFVTDAYVNEVEGIIKQYQ